MRKKIISTLIALLLVFSGLMTGAGSFADSAPDNDKRVIVLDLNKTSLENMLNIKSINKLLENRGYVGLMNVRGDRGYNDRRNFATIGSTGRANLIDEDFVDFRNADEDTAKLYRYATGEKPKQIVNPNINYSLNVNEESGEFKSVMGELGQTLSDNKMKVGVLGNADYTKNGETVYDRAFCLAVMDHNGRIDWGKLDGINKKDLSMPFGISADYDQLEKLTKESIEKNNLTFVELGDTQRLDLYKNRLDKDTYRKMKFRVYNKLNGYVESVINDLEPNDTLYIISAFPSNFDYSNSRRLAPVIKVEGDEKGKGILASPTTRRKGIVANLDIGKDILGELGLDSQLMIGNTFRTEKMDDNIGYLLKDYQKIVSVSAIRMDIINIFVGWIVISWIAGLILILLRNKLSEDVKSIGISIVKELIKIGLIFPASFLGAGILPAQSPTQIAVSIIGLTAAIYIAGRLITKDSVKQLGFYAALVMILVTIDSVIGTPMMKSCIMSYDPMIGARYYGIGNEYEGVTIGATILALACLLQFKKIKRSWAVVIALIVLITSAHPAMGANVGGAISETFAFLIFLLLVYDVKIDFKRVIGVGLVTALVVVVFAVFDLKFGSHSHLGNFVKQIQENGPQEIVLTFTRKIAMNIKIAQISVWVNILIAACVIFFIMLFRPNKHFTKLRNMYPVIFKGFLATAIGSIVTLLVNDSGIVAAATASLYILIPVLIATFIVLYNYKYDKVQ